MDYKEKYNKLVNAIKVLQETNPSDEGIQNWVKDNVPELKESEDDEEIVKLADEYYDKVLIKECDMEEKEAHHCRIAYIHGAKAMLERQKWRPSEEQMHMLRRMITALPPGEIHNGLESLYNELKTLK